MRARTHRLLAHSVKLVLFLAAGAAALRYFLSALGEEGWTPRTFFGLFLLTGALSLVWRATLDLQQVVRRSRSTPRSRWASRP
jgi:hypothetical protein